MSSEEGLVLSKLETDVEIRASPKQFHDVFWSRPHHISNVTPGKIGSVQLLDGDWGKVGAVLLWDYVHDGKAKVAKEIVEAVDPDNNSITFRVIEGDLMKEYKSFTLKIDCNPNPNPNPHKISGGPPGSVVHWTLEYEKLHGAVDHPETLLQFCAEVSKEIDDHLVHQQPQN